jgi:hypothetical protein
MAAAQMRVRNNVLVQEVESMRERAITAEATCGLLIATAKKAGVAQSLYQLEPRLFKHFDAEMSGTKLPSGKGKAGRNSPFARSKASRTTLSPVRTKKGKGRNSVRRGSTDNAVRNSTETLETNEREELERLQGDNERLHALIAQKGYVDSETLQ